jgi:hypothetical protein
MYFIKIMKKLTLIPLALIVLVGAIWASSIITPDKPGFPSNPQTPGTLGYILSLFGTDGTARDSLALGGVSATGYLQTPNATCTNPGEVWKGINTDGTVECGTRGTLLAIGRFSEISWTIEVSTNWTSWTTANTTDTLSEWTIVRTTSGTGTIAFVADDSILRLDTNTTLQLQSGDLGGNTVAQAILSDGRLWGRVLTSTWVNIGGGGLIAGVRGTSISIKKTGTSIDIAVIDSTNQTESAKIYSSNTQIATLTPGTDYKDTDTTDSTPGIQSINTQLLTDTWIQKNTLADITYITDTLSGTTDISKKDRLSKEIMAVLPPNRKIPDWLVNADSKLEIDADSTEDENDSTPEQKSKNKAERIKCKKENPNTRWWKSTGKCEDKNLTAYADYTNGDKNLYFKDGKAELTEVTGVRYGGNYRISDKQKQAIQGKTISFSFPSWKITSSTNQYLFYAKVRTVNYQRYLNINWNEESPPTSSINGYNGKFPDTSTFQIGYLGPSATVLVSPMRLEFK